MGTSKRKPKPAAEDPKPRPGRAFVPTTALAMKVEFDETAMRVTLTDARVLEVPLAWFPRLRKATPDQLAKCEIIGAGSGIHWPDLDEDLSIAGLMAGVNHRSA